MLRDGATVFGIEFVGSVLRLSMPNQNDFKGNTGGFLKCQKR